MKIDQAKTVTELAPRASNDLNSILIELLKGADEEKAPGYKRLIGGILGEIYFEILRPVYETYPELAPAELQAKQ